MPDGVSRYQQQPIRAEAALGVDVDRLAVHATETTGDLHGDARLETVLR